MSFRKTRTALTLATSTTALLAALALPATAQDTTLTLVSWQKDEQGVGDWWAALIDRFEEEHPGVAIEWTKVERGAFADTMMTLFAGGDPPDIVHLASFEFQQFAANGWLENLDPWIAEAGLDLEGWAGQRNCTWDGETVCVMLLYYGAILAYNQAILEAEGLEVPTSWEEFLAAARATTQDTNGDGIVDQFGTGHETRGGGGQHLAELASYILDASADYWTDDEGNVNIDTPEMTEALSRWKTVITEGLTPRDMSSGEVRQLFANGRIAMKVDGPWLYPIIEQAPPEVRDDLHLTMVPFDPPLGGSSNVLGMASEISDEEKQLVWDFIALATSDEFQTMFATLASSTPPSPGADTTEAEAQIPHFPLLVEAQQAASAAGVDRIPTGLEIQFNEFAKIVQEETQRMIIEDLDPAEVAATLQARVEELQTR